MSEIERFFETARKKAEKNIAAKIRKASNEARGIWRKEFSNRRRSPKKVAESRLELKVYDESNDVVGTVEDVRNSIRKGALSAGSRRDKGLVGRAKVASSKAKVAKTKLKKRKNTDWLDVALPSETFEYRRESSPVGTAPYTWKAIPGTTKHNYYLRSSAKVKPDGKFYFRLVLPVWGDEKNVLKALEKGGSVSTTEKRLVGYRLKRTSRNGTEINPIYEKRKRRVRLSPRPFAQKIAKEIYNKARFLLEN